MIDVAEMDLHPGKHNGEPTKNTADFAFDKANGAGVDGDRFVTIDLNLHLVLLAVWAAPEMFWEVE